MRELIGAMSRTGHRTMKCRVPGSGVLLDPHADSATVAAVAVVVETVQAMKSAFVLLVLLITSLRTEAAASEFVDDFSTDPSVRGWRIFGHTGLFSWNSAGGNLDVVWDSRERNSYFYRPLGTVLTRQDDFSLTFDLRLSELKIGVQEGQPFTFQLAVGFLNLSSATREDFMRGSGQQSPNLVEFNYFADSGFGATISPIIVSTNNQFIPSFTFPLEMKVGDLFRIQLAYDGTEKILRTTMTRNQEAFGPIREVKLPSHFTDFRVDTISVSSYSSRGSGGSLLARGVMDNIRVVTPAPPIATLSGRFSDDRWNVEFTGRPGWVYTLERTTDFVAWSSVTRARAQSDGLQSLESPISNDRAFYRVRAERP